MAALVQLCVDAEGNYALGAEISKVFVPFAVVPATRVAHYVERDGILRERAEGEEEGAAEATQALAQGFKPVPAPAPAKAKAAKGAGGEG